MSKIESSEKLNERFRWPELMPIKRPRWSKKTSKGRKGSRKLKFIRNSRKKPELKRKKLEKRKKRRQESPPLAPSHPSENHLLGRSHL
jgi:hypothetical protein